MGKSTLIVISVTLLLCATTYLAYSRGTQASNTFEAIKLMVVVQHQSKCIKQSDYLCIKNTNEVLAHVVAEQINRSHLISQLSGEEKENVKEFLRSEAEAE